MCRAGSQSPDSSRGIAVKLHSIGNLNRRAEFSWIMRSAEFYFEMGESSMRNIQALALSTFLAAGVLAAPMGSVFAQTCTCPTDQGGATAVSVYADEAPPPLPEYDQPPIPATGYLWAPGYWAWNSYEYFWVPGTWIEPPQPGLLWTRAIGRSSTGPTPSTAAIGASASASMAASITDLAMSGSVTRAAVGTTDDSSTTAPSPTSARSKSPRSTISPSRLTAKAARVSMAARTEWTRSRPPKSLRRRRRSMSRRPTTN